MKTHTDALRRLADVLAENPMLSRHGFGTFEDPEIAPSASDRNDALSDKAVAEFVAAGTWLDSCCEINGTVNTEATSYELKHEAEHWANTHGVPPIGYISNGMLIAAVLDRGIAYRRTGPNACLAVEPNVDGQNRGRA